MLPEVIAFLEKLAPEFILSNPLSILVVALFFVMVIAPVPFTSSVVEVEFPLFNTKPLKVVGLVPLIIPFELVLKVTVSTFLVKAPLFVQLRPTEVLKLEGET